ncbi:hypothetical protein P3X46_018083 [Hevea brasiliensis]|uniref:Leucine-rich repeat-containing N-terminal plant-type domain-containing protein n=1 Tax=Hevea brasiliensis TaxID=3981 RepID=A0ABQ9LPP2_HEVBR|nr:hypothetical protein P3X46_018083 [Hevea brasiliensis]
MEISFYGILLYIFFFFFHLSALTHSFNSSLQLRCHDDESLALLQFKKSFIISNTCDYSFGPSKLESWKLIHGERGDCCSWDGVECDDQTNHVISLDLSGSCLSGSINSNSTLFRLVHLQTLNLAYNNFNYSQIPSQVGQLSRLTHLSLSESYFSGQIPSQVLNLSGLISLDLSDDSEQVKLYKPSLRDLVQQLTKLKELDLSGVDISSTVPDMLANFSSLESLRLSSCGLQGEFPIGIFQLPNLKELDISKNLDLKSYLPAFQLGNLLESLILSETNFVGELPSSIGNLAYLEYLDFDSCNFNGQLPSSIGNLTKLTTLSLSNNNFRAPTTSLSWVGKLSDLNSLSLYSVGLNGDFPFSLMNLTHLSSLDLGYNQLTGPIPSWLVNLTMLFELYLDHNHFIGQIPSCLISEASIEYLYLNNNQLSGQIPSQINNHSKLRILEIPSNKLQGSIPSTLSNLRNLKILNFDSNNLSGVVDVNIFFQLKKLRTLFLSHNKLRLLTESSALATVPNFTKLGLASCNLSGFPSFLHNQNELRLLDLSSNNIKGLIPSWVWNISRNSLTYMNLSHNFLTGFEEGPVVLQWAHLTFLDIRSNMLQGSLLSIPLWSTNHFDGSISPAWRNGCNLIFINLSQNKLQGQLPRSLANCSMLEFIDFGENQLHDCFPSWLGNLPKLKVLILRSNGFYGALKEAQIGKFPKLQIIDLSQNTFTGDLPTAYFEIWDAMEIIDRSQMTYMGENKSEYFPFISYDSYDYSLIMTNKGFELEYLKIPSTLAAIDFSCNKFEGVIPNVIGNLTALHLLNLSNNMLTGHIPSSLANMRELECLDLSSNQLSGHVPSQLSQLTFLSYFNVSWNHLSGPVPQGKQFDTFDGNSYKGNSGLCGALLEKKCGSFETIPSTPPTITEEDSGSFFKINWMIILIGYAGGLIVGVVAGNEVTRRKHDWFVKTFGRKLLRRQRKTNTRN